VAAAAPSLAAAVLVAVPELLDAVAGAAPHEPVVRARRAQHRALLGLEGVAGGCAGRAVD